MRILLFNDAPHADILKDQLIAERFDVESATDIDVAASLCDRGLFDVIVLDLPLASFDGLEPIRELRRRRVRAPILVINASTRWADETDAFALGADDYLEMPFRRGVLVARLRALYRSGAYRRPEVMTAGTLSLDPTSRVVKRGGSAIPLTPREFSVLEHLMRLKDTVVTKSDILHHVWDRNYHGPENIVEVYIKNLRRKIDVPFGTNTIETTRGVGYRLVP